MSSIQTRANRTKGEAMRNGAGLALWVCSKRKMRREKGGMICYTLDKRKAILKKKKQETQQQKNKGDTPGKDQGQREGNGRSRVRVRRAGPTEA